MLAGNVVTDSMTEQLILNGADIVKVTALGFIRVCESGMGSGWYRTWQCVHHPVTFQAD